MVYWRRFESDQYSQDDENRSQNRTKRSRSNVKRSRKATMQAANNNNKKKWKKQNKHFTDTSLLMAVRGGAHVRAWGSISSIFIAQKYCFHIFLTNIFFGWISLSSIDVPEHRQSLSATFTFGKRALAMNNSRLIPKSWNSCDINVIYLLPAVLIR